ncbi:MAG: hypothetical protein ACLFPX_06535 [Candidatus Omnitrophota bacterium]
MQITIKEMILNKIGGISCCLCLLAVLIVPKHVLAQEVQGVQPEARRVSVEIEGVYDANVLVIPFNGVKAEHDNPLDEAPGVKSGETAELAVPADQLPGEFVLRINYRAKEEDYPYPAERIIFLNDQDIELTVNPPYINNDLRTKFQDGERENTVYAAFMKENAQRRRPVEALRQFLLNYDRPDSAVSGEAQKAFEQRRREYNKWLAEQQQAHENLFVSRLFQFHYIPPVDWSGDNRARVEDMLAHYFDGIDFNDPLILRSRELTRFLDQYVRLYGKLAQNRQELNEFLIQAGDAITKAAEQGHPRVREWIADYLRRGYESQGIIR